MSGVKDFNVLKEEIVSKVQNNINFKTLANSDIRVNTLNSKDYRSIIRLLKGAKLQTKSPLCDVTYYTFQCKQEKPYKIVIRGLHPSTNVSDIKNELEQLGHDVVRVTNIIVKRRINKALTKVALLLFFVDLVSKPSNKNVYELNYMLNCRIKVEPPRKKSEIPQCKRCQSFGHTQNYCQRQAMCVKCGESHHSTECKKPKKAPCKCANCGQDHTANWKDCPVYKAKLALKQTPTTVTQRLNQRTWKPADKVIQDKSYATGGKFEQSNNDLMPTQTKRKEPTILDIWEILQSIQQKASNTERRLELLEEDRSSWTTVKSKKRK